MARRRNSGFSRGYVSKDAGKVADALRAAGVQVEAAAKAALKDGAEMIVSDAKSRCPVYAETLVKRAGKTYRYIDKRAKPGTLRDSIRADSRQGGAAYAISANAKADSRRGAVYYGAIVEFSPKINRPFLYPALDGNRDAVYQNVRQAVASAIRGGGKRGNS